MADMRFKEFIVESALNASEWLFTPRIINIVNFILRGEEIFIELWSGTIEQAHFSHLTTNRIYLSTGQSFTASEVKLIKARYPREIVKFLLNLIKNGRNQWTPHVEEDLVKVLKFLGVNDSDANAIGRYLHRINQ